MLLSAARVGPDTCAVVWMVISFNARSDSDVSICQEEMTVTAVLIGPSFRR